MPGVFQSSNMVPGTLLKRRLSFDGIDDEVGSK
jgi:hypothetical protein